MKNALLALLTIGLGASAQAATIQIASSASGGSIQAFSGQDAGHNAVNAIDSSLGANSYWEDIWSIRDGSAPAYIEIALAPYAGSQLTSLQLWNRPDGCCQDRLDNFDVTFLDDSTANGGTVLHTINNTVQVPSGTGLADGTTYNLPAGLVTATHLRIQHTENSEHFHVGEISVLADTIPEPSSLGLLALSAVGIIMRRRR